MPSHGTWVIYSLIMAMRGQINHTVAAMRIALVGQPTLRFDAMSTIGPAPVERSVIESITAKGREVLVQWDDGIVLSTALRLSGEWHLYRNDEMWHKETYRARVVIEVEGWVAVCFDAPIVETYRQHDRKRHPQSGGVGPNISHPKTDLSGCTQRLLDYRYADAMISDVLMDESVMSGLGNVARSETLWAVGLSPFAKMADLSYEDCAVLIETASRIVQGDHEISPSVYGRNGQRCNRCRGTVEFKIVGASRRNLYWCPDCQGRLDRRLIPSNLLQGDHTPTHPAELIYFSDAVAARKRFKIFDDLDKLG
jgi:endonuclease-8